MKDLVTRWIARALVVLVAASCQTADESADQATASDTADQAAMTDAAAHQAAVTAFIDVYNSAEYEKLGAIVAPEFRRRAPDQNVDGVDGMKEFMRNVHTAYSDFHIEVHDSAYDEDVAFIHWTVTGTYSGEGSAPTTGNPIEIGGATMLRFSDGMITEEVAYYDTATLESQLGVESVPHTR